RIRDLAPVAPSSEVELDRKVLDQRGDPVLATRLFHSREHPTLRMRTKEGFELTGTVNHPVMCLTRPMGVPMLAWRLLSELKPGDCVVIARQPAPSGTVIAEHESQTALLAGALVSEQVPELIWSGSAEVKRVFLRALFEGDGSSSLLPRSTIQISYSTRSVQLARDVQALLLEFGVISRQCAYNNGEVKVVITNRRDARLF